MKTWTCPKCGYASSLSVSKKTVVMGCGKCGTSVDYKDGEIAALHITELAKPKPLTPESSFEEFDEHLKELEGKAKKVIGDLPSFHEFMQHLTVEGCGSSAPFVINEMQRNILEVIEARAVPPKIFLPKCRSRISYASLLLARKKKGLR